MRAVIALFFVAMAAPAAADEAEAVSRLVKRAERAGFERHDVKGWWRAMAKDVARTTGRREVPDAHDYTLSGKALREVHRLRWRRAATGRTRLYFHDENTSVEGGAAVYTAEVSHHFFGGSEVTRRRYELKRVKKRWRITKVRIWWVRQNTAGEVEDFDNDFWLDADAKVEDLRKEKVTSLEAVLAGLVKARRLKEAYQATVDETKRESAKANAWIARANMALELGLLDDARKALRRARKLDPLVDVPEMLKK